MPAAEAASANSLAETLSPRGGNGLPAPGQIVRVRQRLYLVEQTVAAPRAGDSTLVRMSCVDDDAQGQPLEVLWEREIDPKIITGEAWDAIARRGFDAPNLFSAYLNTLRWNCVTATDPKLFQSPFRAGIRLDAYQLEPLRKALLLPRVNLFIADDVGLGKTIEALLIARELLLRKKVKEIVVACPPSMLLQWRDEMEQRFGLTFEILDKAYMARVRRERGYGVNPWSTHTRFLISHRLLIDEAYTNPLLDWLDTFRGGTLLILDEAHHAAPSSGQKYAIDSQITRAIRELAPRFEHRLFLSATPHNGHSNSFSALLEILDPQRFCRGVPVTKKMLDDVMVRRLKEDIREVVGGFAKRTVVQLDIDGLSAAAPELRLSALLDQYRTLREQRLAGETKRKQAAAGLLVSGLQQRLLSSIDAFARTLKVHRRTVQRQWEQAMAAGPAVAGLPTEPRARPKVSDRTGDLTVGRSGGVGRPAPSDDGLLLAAEHSAATDYAHRQRREESAQPASPASVSPVQLDLLSGGVGADDDRANLPEEELRAEEEAQIEAASAATIGPLADAGARAQFVREQKLLDEMSEIAEQARGQADARIKLLIRWIQENMLVGQSSPHTPWADIGKRSVPSTLAGAKWNDLRIIIFTEYDDTKRYLHQQLLSAIERTDQGDGRIAIFHGPTPADEREEIKQAFNGDPAKYPVRILIATDAAREGLNLQAHCWNLFHFDVPWNPSRMEQRNGRIDRKLQPKTEVFCHYFVYRQRPEDRILRCLVRKTERIKQELGSLAQVIDVRLADSLKLGIRRSQIDEMEKKIDSVDLDADRRRIVEDELEASRDRQDALREQIEQLRTQLGKSQTSIGLDQEHFQLAISSALELMGAEPLKPVDGHDGGAPRCVFPPLDQREGADPTWADTMDTLRAPRPRDQKRWEWRRTSPIRPVVFEDQGTMDDRVVHLHLEHRIVQRLLGRFIAQGFVHHDLSRACLTQTSDAIPRVILLGRLCLYGPGAARLHEELIPVTARWTDPKLRKSPLTPYARDAETKTLDLLEDSLRPQGGRAVTSEVQSQLQACAPRDVQELLSHLQTRGEQYAEDAKKKLVARADAEAKAMREILETQKKHIQDTAAVYAKNDSMQLKLRFGLDEPTDEEERRQLEANKRHWGKRLGMIDEELKTEPVRIREVYDVKAARIEPVGLIYLWPVTG